IVAALRILRWRRVRAQKGAANGQAVALSKSPRDSQLLALMLEREPVSRFDLDGADALEQPLLQPRCSQRKQLFFVRGSRRAHRRGDAAAGAGDLFITCALEAHGELVGPLPRINEVSMTIDESRRDR